MIGSFCLVLACSGKVVPVTPRAEPKPAPPPKARWPLVAESATWPTSTEDWFVSQGHFGGTSEALVRVSPDAFEAYRQHTPGATLPPGSALIMLHRSRTTGKPGVIHAMVRARAAGKNPDTAPSSTSEPTAPEAPWEYLVLDPEGGIEQRGALPLCSRCHLDAPADSVFGPPRRAEPAAPTPAATEAVE